MSAPSLGNREQDRFGPTSATQPARVNHSVCVWMTGLSGSGKTTTAEALHRHLRRVGRQATILDGDAIRHRASRAIGFSREARAAHCCDVARRAAELLEQGHTVICALISPYEDVRQTCRSIVGVHRFVEVFVRTPIDVCEARDPKGLYARARRREIMMFTGIDDVYEPPSRPDMTIDTIVDSPERNAAAIIAHIDTMERRGLAT